VYCQQGGKVMYKHEKIKILEEIIEQIKTENERLGNIIEKFEKPCSCDEICSDDVQDVRTDEKCEQDSSNIEHTTCDDDCPYCEKKIEPLKGTCWGEEIRDKINEIIKHINGEG